MLAAEGEEVVVAAGIDEVAVVVSDKAAVFVETVAGAAWVVEPVLENEMAELASSLAGTDWLQAAKVVTFDWWEFA